MRKGQSDVFKIVCYWKNEHVYLARLAERKALRGFPGMQ